MEIGVPNAVIFLEWLTVYLNETGFDLTDRERVLANHLLEVVKDFSLLHETAIDLNLIKSKL